MTKVDTTIVAIISNGKVIIYRPIGEDCTFSHYEKHKVIKGYIQKAESEDNEINRAISTGY